jgi:phospholipid/cholesterol/gamma-HCH transport system substrate-binding protein
VSVAIRKHLRDFLAILFLVLVAAGVSAYILSNQRLYLPGWVPLVGTDFYEVKAEFQTAQAVVPGQGQTVNVAGVPVGDIGKVELEDGVAVVEMKIRRKYAPIYRDATILLRPKTGLKDMFLELDPGTQAAGEVPEGGRVPVESTLPDVNLDEVLSNLDADARSYLQVLLGAGGEAFGDEKGSGPAADSGTEIARDGQTASADLRETFKRFEPTSRDVEAVFGKVAQRRRNLRRFIRNYRLLIGELGTKDRQLAELVDSSNANFQALAEQDRNLRAALRELPGTLGVTRSTLGKADRLARTLGPALQSLRPAARALGPALRDTRPFLRDSTPIIREQLRPFARSARRPVRRLRRAAEELAPTTPRLVRTLKVVNALLNELAFNPAGSEEGFLFWASWVNHAGASVFSTQDAHGAIRRGLFITSCNALSVLDQVGQVDRRLALLVDLLNAPRQSEVCPEQTPATPSSAKRGSADAGADGKLSPLRSLGAAAPATGGGN